MTKKIWRKFYGKITFSRRFSVVTILISFYTYWGIPCKVSHFIHNFNDMAEIQPLSATLWDLMKQHIYPFFLSFFLSFFAFLEFINIVSILYYTFIEFIILLYTFLVISLAQWKECMISFSKFSDVLPVFTFARYRWSLKHLWRS